MVFAVNWRYNQAMLTLGRYTIFVPDRLEYALLNEHISGGFVDIDDTVDIVEVQDIVSRALGIEMVHVMIVDSEGGNGSRS
jgi:hypothetical protein